MMPVDAFMKVSFLIHPSLVVEEIEMDEEKSSEMGQLFSGWGQIAMQKRDASCLTDDEETTRLFESSLQIAGSLENDMWNAWIHGRYDRLFVCRDVATNTIQAAATLYYNDSIEENIPPGKYFELKYLATHPRNIRANINANEAQVHGAASAIIKRIGEEVLRQNLRGISVGSTESAKGFYRKKGFTQFDNDSFCLLNEDIRRLYG